MLMLSGIVRMQRYPFIVQTRASPIPVFPLVGSTTTPPSRRRPSRSATSMMLRQMRSLTEAPGLTSSDLAKTFARGGSADSLPISMMGVSPIRFESASVDEGVRGQGRERLRSVRLDHAGTCSMT